MNEQSAELRRLISVVQIEDVRLVEGFCRTDITADQATPSGLVAQPMAALVKGIQADGTFLIRAKFDAHVIPNDAPQGKPVMAYGVVHELRYRVPTGDTFTDDTLKKFASINGIFNAWPYWREFVQRSTAQMGMPPFVLPVFHGGQAEPIVNAPRSDTNAALPTADRSKESRSTTGRAASKKKR